MATCPNCKTELVEVNGRYICSECGKEVPAAEINVGSWGDTAQTAAVEADPEPGSNTITEDEGTLLESEDYIEGSGKTVIPPETNQVDEAPVAEEKEKIVVAPPETPTPESHEAEEPTKEGFYTAQDQSPDQATSNQPDLQVNEVETEPEVSRDTAPVPDPLPASVNQQRQGGDSTNVGAGYEKSAPDDPLYQLPGDQKLGMPEAEDFYQEPVKPVAGDPLAKGGQALPQDEGIYRDPIYEDGENTQTSTAPVDTSVGTTTIPGNTPAAPKSRESKINRIILIAGIVTAVLLLAGGIVAYFIFTAKSNVDENTGGGTVTETNCDNAGTEADKQACIAKAFSACDVAQWSGTYPGTASDQNRKVNYEIQGTVDNACQVDETFVADTVNSDTIGKTMSCTYDNTTTFDKALSTNSATNCTGDLADIIFGTTTTNTDDTSGGASN